MPDSEEQQKADDVERDLKLASAYRDVFGDDKGMMVLRDLFEEAKFFGGGFHPDPHENSHNAGMRTICAHIMDKMAFPTNPEEMLQQLEELKKDRGLTDENW